MSLFAGPVDPVAFVTSLTALAAAVGVGLKHLRDMRQERKSRRRDKKSLEHVARAAAQHSPVVAGVVDELERTGAFQRPAILEEPESAPAPARRRAGKSNYKP